MRTQGHRNANWRRLLIVGASLALAGGVLSCRSDEPVTQTVTAAPMSSGAATTKSDPTELGAAATPTTSFDAAERWSYDSTRVPSSQGGSWCVQLTNAGDTATTCLSLPGVQRITVGGAQFALTLGQLRFSDGDVAWVDANGVAVAPVRGRSVQDDLTETCGAAGVGAAIAAAIDAAESAPSTAWMIVRCAPDKAAVVAFNLPDEQTAFLDHVGTTWRVVHVTAATDACRTVPAIADICSSLAL